VLGVALDPEPTVAGDLGTMGALPGIIGFPTLGPTPFTIDFVRGQLRSTT